MSESKHVWHQRSLAEALRYAAEEVAQGHSESAVKFLRVALGLAEAWNYELDQIVREMRKGPR